LLSNQLEDKLKRVMDINKQSMSIYEKDRKRAKEESQRLFSDKGYIAGPGEIEQSEGIPEFSNDHSSE